MDRGTYCEEMANRLRGVAEFLAAPRISLPPSTREASKQQADRQKMVRRLNTLNAEALAKVDALRTNTNSTWEAARQNLAQRWAEIAELKARLMHPIP
jgi:hypothetical protein